MQLTSRTDYAMRAMVALAQLPEGKYALARDIAGDQQVPPNFLPQIMGDLRRAGLVEALRGQQGGFRLARSAEDINAREVVEAIEGPIVLYRCLNTPVPCARPATCEISALWSRMQQGLVETLEKTALSQLAAGETGHDGLCLTCGAAADKTCKCKEAAVVPLPLAEGGRQNSSRQLN